LNYIGLNSWSLYRCPDRSTFDEVSQQCLVKIPINDAFEQLSLLPSAENAQFHRIASFILATPTPNEDEGFQEQRGLVSLPPTIDRFMEPFSLKRLLRKVRKERKINEHVWFLFQRAQRDISEDASSVIWSHGYPLMKLNNKPIFQRKLPINAKLNHFSVVVRQPIPVSEGHQRTKPSRYNNFHKNFLIYFRRT
jgi:hypothetical protein